MRNYFRSFKFWSLFFHRMEMEWKNFDGTEIKLHVLWTWRWGFWISVFEFVVQRQIETSLHLISVNQLDSTGAWNDSMKLKQVQWLWELIKNWYWSPVDKLLSIRACKIYNTSINLGLACFIYVVSKFKLHYMTALWNQEPRKWEWNCAVIINRHNYLTNSK